MPPPIRGFGGGGGPANMGGPFHQIAGFPNAHGVSVSAPNQSPALSQYMASLQQQQQQANAFSTNGFAAAGVGAGGVGAGGFSGTGTTAGTGFANQNARMSFAHAPNMAHQQQHVQSQHDFVSDHAGLRHAATGQQQRRIRDVWAHTLQEEMALVRDMVKLYPYVAMDTEFPGVVCRPMGKFRGKSDYHYQLLRTNIDLLNLIQVGIAFFDENGNPPPVQPSQADMQLLSPTSKRLIQSSGLPLAIQFNFKFDLENDMFNEKSIEALQIQGGINFDLLKRDGIDPQQFAAMLIPSGLVCFEEVTWIAFHGGYDFGYLAKNLLNMQLPSDESDFSQLMRKYFPSIFDVKWLMKTVARMVQAGQGHVSELAEIMQKYESKQSLDNLADTFKLKRIGRSHTAGSDAFLTGKVFFNIRDKIFGGNMSKDHMNKVWGLAIPDGLFTAAMMGNTQDAAGMADDAAVRTTTGINHQDSPAAAAAATAVSAAAAASAASIVPSALSGSGLPSTPSTTTVSLAASTPAAQLSYNPNSGPMTPGSGVGVFGAFNYGSR